MLVPCVDHEDEKVHLAVQEVNNIQNLRDAVKDGALANKKLEEEIRKNLNYTPLEDPPGSWVRMIFVYVDGNHIKTLGEDLWFEVEDFPEKEILIEQPVNKNIYGDWSKEFPKEPGSYWFYGYGENLGTKEKIHYVEISLTRDGSTIGVSEGQFVYAEESFGRWQKAILPALPKNAEEE